MGAFANKLFRIVKRYETPLTFLSGALIVAGIAFDQFAGLKTAAAILYLSATVLTGLPIVLRALMGLRLKTVGIELLLTIAIVGALYIQEYDEAAIVTFLFQLGEFLEQRTLNKTRKAIKDLAKMAPSVGRIIRPSGTEKIAVSRLKAGDRLLVWTGEKIPVDGTIESGEGYIDEATINGESVPKRKAKGAKVFAGTLLDNGTLEIKADRIGKDTTFAKIMTLVEQAQDAKSPAERFIDRFAKWYTPLVVLMTIITGAVTKSIDTAITVLVLSCPGALVIGAPVANVAGIGRGAKDSILLKGGNSVATFAKVDTVFFDKTGTLTIGHPVVTETISYAADLGKALALAASLESISNHPLAKAIVDYGKAQHVQLYGSVNGRAIAGLGIAGEIEGSSVMVGSANLMRKEGLVLSPAEEQDLKDMEAKGNTAVFLAIERKIVLLFAIADAIRPNAKETIQGLRKLGIKRMAMLTGDNETAAKTVAQELGLDDFEAQLLPQDKLQAVRESQKEGHVVAFVGDGINDSPALAGADIGIALGGGTDVAIETSDVVLLKDDLGSIPKALKLAKRIVLLTYENIVIAILTVLLLLLGLFAGYIHMASGMFVHEASVLFVILNAMRLLITKREKKKIPERLDVDQEVISEPNIE